GTCHCFDARSDLIDHRDQDGHPEVFKGTGVRSTTLLDVDFVDTKAPRKPLGLDQGCVALAQRYNALVLKFRKNQLFLGPDATNPAQAGIKELFPVRCRSLL